MTSVPPDEPGSFASTLQPSRAHQRFALLILCILVLALALAIPFADVSLTGSEIWLPAYASAITVSDTITAALIFSAFSILRSRALLVLGIGYLFAAATTVPWALTFPGVFAADGLLGANLQSTAVVAAAKRVGFPLFVLCFVLLKDRPVPATARPRVVIWTSVAAVLAGVCALTWLAVDGGALLPRFMQGPQQVAALWTAVPVTAAVFCVAGIAVLAVRRKSVLDLWLLVVLAAWLIELFMLAFVSGGERFSLGWWAGRVYGLAAASVVLLVLLWETTTLHIRLAQAVAAEERTRTRQLSTMEALSASVAHEVNQPLSSMVTNADAGLRWLDRSEPNLSEASAAFGRIISDGHRAGQVITSIRSMFRKDTQEWAPVSVAGLIDEAVLLTQDEARFARVSVVTASSGDLPAVIGDRVRLQQVLVNLIANALDAMHAVNDRARLLNISAERDGGGDLIVAVADTGQGLDPQLDGTLFEPFTTTKPDGMGMGLLICRSIIEAHGGRLWAENHTPHGAVFRFALPASAQHQQATGSA